MTTRMLHKLRADSRRALADFCTRSRSMMRQLARELTRLNRARLGREELVRLARKQRPSAVKQALDAHHRGAARCC